jgi:uncharacterized protein (TIGR02996 family)
MNPEPCLLDALHADPGDAACWLALADCLEETGRPEQAELLRLRLALQSAEIEDRPTLERRLLLLLDAGVHPPAPLLAGPLGLRLALVPPGSFWMGSPPDEPGRHHDEGPRHRVELTRAFYLGVYPVTQAQYQAVAGHNPSHFRHGGEGAAPVRNLDTSAFPVERVSWQDAVAFCRRLSELPQEKAAGRVYRLPTEAEWEYACRAGTSTMFHYGDALTSDRANIDGNLPEGDAPRGLYLARTCPVGRFPANAFGLHDMHGNVWEWCSDWFDATYYEHSPAADPTGPAHGKRRALRGGGWFYGARICRSAYRYRYEPDNRHNDFGLRVALDAGGGRGNW